jgi:hypothetical protein
MPCFNRVIALLVIPIAIPLPGWSTHRCIPVRLTRQVVRALEDAEVDIKSIFLECGGLSTTVLLLPYIVCYIAYITQHVAGLLVLLHGSIKG